eukprot:jgi/Botrbrau1/23671/Bobra.55_2s0052.1
MRKVHVFATSARDRYTYRRYICIHPLLIYVCIRPALCIWHIIISGCRPPS